MKMSYIHFILSIVAISSLSAYRQEDLEKFWDRDIVRIEHADLSGVNFAGEELRNRKFSKVNFSNCTFDSTCNLDNCDFFRCNFFNSSWYGVALNWMVFTQCNMQNVSMFACIYNVVIFTACSFGGANLEPSDLTGASFAYCDMRAAVVGCDNFDKPIWDSKSSKGRILTRPGNIGVSSEARLYSLQLHGDCGHF